MLNNEPTPESVTEIPAPTAPAEVPEEKRLTPLKAIRAKCLDCSGDSKKELALCPVEDCPQWPFRCGRDPFRKKTALTGQQKLEYIARINNIRE